MSRVRAWRAAWARWKSANRDLGGLSGTEQREVRDAIREGRTVRDPGLAAVVVELAEARADVFYGGVRSPAMLQVAAITIANFVVIFAARWLVTGDVALALRGAGYFTVLICIVPGLLLAPLGLRRRESFTRAAEFNRPLVERQEAEARHRAAVEDERRRNRTLEQRLADLDDRLEDWRKNR